MNFLDRYATVGQIDGIKALLAKGGVDGDFRKGFERILAKLESE